MFSNPCKYNKCFSSPASSSGLTSEPLHNSKLNFFLQYLKVQVPTASHKTARRSPLLLPPRHRRPRPRTSARPGRQGPPAAAPAAAPPPPASTAGRRAWARPESRSTKGFHVGIWYRIYGIK